MQQVFFAAISSFKTNFSILFEEITYKNIDFIDFIYILVYIWNEIYTLCIKHEYLF